MKEKREKSKVWLSPRQVAFVSVFAALSVVIIMTLPGIPIIGLAGAKITLDAVLAPVYGLVIGPYLGALAAFIGGIVVAGYKGWPIFSVMTSFCPAVSALVAGALTQKSCGLDRYRSKGWLVAAFVLIMLVVGWYLTWVGQGAPFYPILHLAGLLTILTLRDRLAEFFVSNIKWKLTATVALSSYCGLVADHMLGNLIFISGVGWFIPVKVAESWLKALGLPSISALFMYVLPISIVERVVMSAIAIVVGVALILALRAANLMPRLTT
ncbi:MAG: hypothetical protein AOA65_1448 [Candidatus Bathyarchaeota archaeon BA1]|nr:MAG: hypothetical protein AOA65_1448 [Candidatus Bathyarchaeota archaeon BA1]